MIALNDRGYDGILVMGRTLDQDGGDGVGNGGADRRLGVRGHRPVKFERAREILALTHLSNPTRIADLVFASASLAASLWFVDRRGYVLLDSLRPLRIHKDATSQEV